MQVSLNDSSKWLSAVGGTNCTEFQCSHIKAYVLVLLWKPAQTWDPRVGSFEKCFSVKISIPEQLLYMSNTPKKEVAHVY